VENSKKNWSHFTFEVTPKYWSLKNKFSSDQVQDGFGLRADIQRANVNLEVQARSYQP
jgi:hypothetical protein